MPPAALLARTVATSPSEAPRARPFLKWAGGKQQLLPALLDAAPPDFGRYFEPFVGGGALFFAMAAARPRLEAVLGDANAELIATYTAVRDDLDALAGRLERLEQQYLHANEDGRAAQYYHLRDQVALDAVEAAARLIFLNKTCFNGLYRVNRAGRFNVPHGRYARPRILDGEALRAASLALRGAELAHQDFVASAEGATAGDLVYFDPPFHPLSPTSSFTQYTSADFAWEDQLRLRECIDALTARGVHVVLSDSPHPALVELYEDGGYDVGRVPARRAINSRGDRRGPIDELLVTNATKLGRPRARQTEPGLPGFADAGAA